MSEKPSQAGVNNGGRSGLSSTSPRDQVTVTVDGIRPGDLAQNKGATLGRYVVIDRIGGGGMGVVFSAYDPKLDRTVAVKLLRPDADQSKSADPDSTARHSRLFREAQAMARLSHPNVAAVYDVGTVDNQVFIAMEYVAGRTIRRWLGGAPRSWRDVLRVFIDAARGLAAAHAADLLHRDFKPENVLIGNDGRVRVVDFGLARFTNPPPTIDASRAKHEVILPNGSLRAGSSRSGAMVGTPAYMSPEQWLDEPVDARADQFSFCVALYEALYSERPFAGEDVNALMQAVCNRASKSRARPRESPRTCSRSSFAGSRGRRASGTNQWRR